MGSRPTRLSPIDIAFGRLFGYEPAPRAPLTEALGSPRAELDRAMVDALTSGPVIVSFSGGRDSAAVLAVAVHVARREGLPDPVPLTRVFPGLIGTEEGGWQELVIRHLGIDEWVRDPLTDEMDLLGPNAQALLREFGVIWPATIAANLLTTRHARGAVVLDGEGGDEVMTPRLHRIAPFARTLRARRLPSAGQARGLAVALGPAAVRRRWGSRAEASGPMPWLRPHIRREYLRLQGEEYAQRPLSFSASVTAITRQRGVAEWRRNRDFLAHREGADWRSPLFDSRFGAAFASAAGRLGFATRADALTYLVGDLLPPEVCTRVDKARMAEAFVNRYTRAFTENWRGEGLDGSLVDPAAVAERVRSHHDARTALLVQSAWLATEGATVVGPAS